MLRTNSDAWAAALTEIENEFRPRRRARKWRADVWRMTLAQTVIPCPRCGQLVKQPTKRQKGALWDLSATDAAIVAELRGIHPEAPKLGRGISRPHVCPLPLFPGHEPKR